MMELYSKPACLFVPKVKILLVYLLGEIMGLLFSSFTLLTLCFRALKITPWFQQAGLDHAITAMTLPASKP